MAVAFSWCQIAEDVSELEQRALALGASGAA
jgi:hypothetical protein